MSKAFIVNRQIGKEREKASLLTPSVELDLFDIWSLLVIPACLFVYQVELDNILDEKHRMHARKAFPKTKMHVA